MSDGNALNVVVGVVGGIFSGALGSSLPTDAASATESALIADGFAKNGYVHPDGVTQAMGTNSSQIMAWGGDTVRTVQTEHTLTYAFQAIEQNEATLKMYYGEAATSTEVEIRGEMLPVKSWVFVIRDGNKRIVIVIPRGQVTERGDVVFKGDQAAGLPVTITAYPDDSGVKAYLYIGDVVVGAPTVASISPATGDVAGSEVIVVEGTGFVNVSSVKIGGVPVLAYNVDSAAQITAVTPPGEEGVTNLIVKTAAGSSADNAASEYEYTNV